MNTKLSAIPKKYYSHESDRLHFRALTSADIDHWKLFFEDLDSLRFLGMGSPEFKDLSDTERSAKWINRQLERMTDGTFGQLAVIEKSSGAMIGLGGLIARSDDGLENEIEVTYSLLLSARGKGYATELARHFKEWAFENIALDSVISIIHVDNEPSINVALKNGMSFDKKMEYMGMPVGIYRALRNA